ncbi:SPP1 gp7 family putative phage head morphogenesis protein [Cytobacillus horneckiae]|uniref:minor capsid protein n=1 Tax=Cytobacillus horneckiae TaxID=549687 RepID=UPI0019D25CF5|nr:minor capsid protein [Cytobacillus horneckiae]MBN6890073.1 minor capsid protein [Cytobacillus horneckiae]
MSSYWRERELQHIENLIQNDSSIAQKLRNNQLRALDEIERLIEHFYGRYASTEGISMEEARKRIGKLDMERYERLAKRYVAERKFTKKANEEMRLYNASMRINRLQLLMLEMQLEIIAATSDDERLLFEEMIKSAKAEYERQAGILGESLNHNQKKLAAIVNSSFLNAAWSDRLWSNQTALRSELEKLLNRGILQGINSSVLARDLRKVINSSISNSERLMRTEMARVQGDVFKDSMKQGDYDAYEYIAEPSACPICKALDGKVFQLNEMTIGVNMYPMHPNCKCATAAAMNRVKLETELDSRGLNIENSNIQLLNNENKNEKIEELRKRIISDEQSKKIEEGQQNKHIDGTNEYKQYVEKYKKKGQYGPSVITITFEQIQNLIAQFHGKGEIIINKNGQWNNTEIILDNDTVIGRAINNLNGKDAETTVFKIHYSNDGVHIVPDYPSKKRKR